MVLYMTTTTPPLSCPPVCAHVLHVFVYTRISDDKSGRAEGVDGQKRYGLDYAAATWPGVPVKVWCDNDLSAADPKTYRPDYEAMLSAIARGEAVGVWAIEQSRPDRTEMGWFRFGATMLAAGLPELHTKRDGIVKIDSVVAGIKAVLNAAEVRQIRARVLDKLDDNARQGRPTGARVYGYARAVDAAGGKTLAIVPTEAEAIRSAAELLLTGWSLVRVAAELRKRGHQGGRNRKVRHDDGTVTVEPTEITENTVRGWFRAPTIAGQRVHRGQIVGVGVWPAILDLPTWHAVRDHLAGPRVVLTANDKEVPVPATSGRRRAPLRYLLSGGLAVCAVCGATAKGTTKAAKRPGAPRQAIYKCDVRRGGKGCVSADAASVEGIVVAALMAKLGDPAFLALMAVDETAARRDEITTALRALEGQGRELAAMWSRRDITSDEWRIAKAGLVDEEKTLRLALADVPAPMVAGLDFTVIGESWESMTLEERQEVLRAFMARVVIDRARPGLHRFDDDRVTIEWRTVGG